MRFSALLLAATLATPAFAQTQPQTGPFPLNSVTDREHSAPQGETLRPSVKALQQTLTELQQLQLQTKQAHWNVSGTLFYPLHELLQEHYEGVAKYADEVAERLQSIGVSSDGRANTIIRNSRVPEFPGGFVDDAQVITWFAHNYKVVSDEIGQGIKDTNDSDPTTANLLQEVQHAIDKYQWQFRAMIQATPTDPNTGADLNNGRAVAPAGRPTPPIQ
ncbi:DNA starvation/stationary phase protection protein [Sphingomonas sp. MA1305]|jgi:starvation-inducible DNA-binding protein|uniref:Dps family protein n=1 Tax=unclassified Sphingomonas TaxID=196159 RepID=UPI0018DFF7E4|nr:MULTISPECIES: DNA starvation/stationary phase protection protein [unclassified Sphingomonas]MBI0476977.1 DNA starvation/stationary phase protection protein [Sphingomonas sp. MA1305]MCP4025523.1 DNA starvation/stationary phase protection protein [Sphingomonas sp.]